jgi:hypothetical protein
MHRRVVTLACTALAATIAVLVPPAAEAQRVVVRRDGSAQPPRTARTPARTPARTARPPARRPVATTQRATVVQVRRAESGPSRQLTLSVGALRYEPDGDDNHPMAALRADWRLRRWLFSELGASYALADLDPTPGDPADEDVNSSLVTATVGLRAELPWPYVRPYVGAAAGLFARFDGDTDTRDGDSFVRPTLAFPVGVRLPLTSQLALRAEARFRFDEHRDGASVPNVEQTVGLSFRF